MSEPSKSLMKSLGQFVGHIWRGVTQSPDGAKKTVVKREVDERETTDASGQRVILRRTTTEEIEVRPDKP